MSRLDRIMWHVYTGGLAKQVANKTCTGVFSAARTARIAADVLSDCWALVLPMAVMAAMWVWLYIYTCLQPS